jgi:hypothetical protein
VAVYTLFYFLGFCLFHNQYLCKEVLKKDAINASYITAEVEANYWEFVMFF